MTSNTDVARLAAEIEATQLVLVAYLAGIADASLGGRRHIEAMYRLAGRLAEAAPELTSGGRQTEHARHVQKALDTLKALTL
jgi:hypothetical protein